MGTQTNAFLKGNEPFVHFLDVIRAYRSLLLIPEEEEGSTQAKSTHLKWSAYLIRIWKGVASTPPTRFNGYANQRVFKSKTRCAIPAN